MNTDLQSPLNLIFRSALEILETEIRGTSGQESPGPTPDDPVVSIHISFSYGPWSYCIALIVLDVIGEDGSYGQRII